MIRRTNSHEHGLVRLVAGVAAALAVVRVARDVVRSPTLVRVWVEFAESLDHSIGWHRMPLPLAHRDLAGIARQTARAEPPRHQQGAQRRNATRPPGNWHALPDRALARRLVQRPAAAGDGQHQLALRSQRATRPHLPRRRRAADDTQSAHGQPRAPGPRHVQTGHDAQPAGGRVAAVHGPRLAQPRPQRKGQPDRGAARAGRRLARATDAHPAHARATPLDPRAPTATRPRSSTRPRRGGTPRSCMAAAPTCWRNCAPASAAS